MGVGWGWGLDWLSERQAGQFPAGFAIWLANLPLPIRVQTTLVELNESRSWSRFEKPEKKFFFDVDIVVKQIECGFVLSV